MNAKARQAMLPHIAAASVERFRSRELRSYVVYAAFILILVVFAVVLRDDGFLTSRNLINIGRQAAPIAVMAVGMAFALAASEIDLSIGSVVALSSLVAADVAGNFGAEAVGFILAALAGLAVGVAVGLVNGLIVVKVRIPSFLVTLGMLGIVSGLARNMNDLQSLPIRNDLFLTVFNRGWGPVSWLVLWIVFVGVLGALAMYKLRFGRHVLAVGSDRETARSVGIKTDRVRVLSLVISATAASFAGLLLAGRLAIGRHDLGENDLLTVIAAVVIGGTSLFGGQASIGGAIVGSLIMAMLNNGLILMGLEVADQMIARGVIIILAVALSMREKREG